ESLTFTRASAPTSAQRLNRMVEALKLSWGSAMKLLRSSTRKIPAALKSNSRVLSNSTARAFGTAGSLAVSGNAIGIGRKFAPDISITGACADAKVASGSIKQKARGGGQSIFTVGTPIGPRYREAWCAGDRGAARTGQLCAPR